MKKTTETKLSQQERQIAERTGKSLAEKGGIAKLTEGDIFDAIILVTDAIALPREKIHAFNLRTYKSILKERPSDDQFLMDHFRKELAEVED